MSSGFVDHYRMLGVDPDCSSEEIRQAFRKRLLEIHPDKVEHPRDPEELRMVLEAFEVLSDDPRRDRYDQMWKIIVSQDPDQSSIPHVTESDRPSARVRTVLYLLLEQRVDGSIDGTGAGRETLPSQAPHRR